LVPAAFEIVGDLSERQREQGEGGEAKRAEHDGRWKIDRRGERSWSVCKKLLGQRGVSHIL
jgi:hypothetical protein